MKKPRLRAVVMLTCLLGAGMGAGAQDADAVVVTVPFDFVAGVVTLPAGEYRVSRVNPAENLQLAISGSNRKSAFLFPLAFNDGPAYQSTFSFERVGNKYVLSRIQILSGVYTVATPRARVMVGRANSQGAVSSSGTR